MTARDYALIEIDARPLPRWPRMLPHREKSAAPADPRDRALAEQIVQGVIKNVLLLQHLVGHYANRSLRSVDPLVQKIIAIGLYQVRFLERIPESAAVDEAVEQTRRFRRRKASGFVNAVLRNAVREPHPPLPRAEEDPQRHAEIVLSHPPELFARLQSLFGTEDALALCRRHNEEPPMIVRLFQNARAEQLQPDGVRVHPHEQANMFIIEGAKQPLLAEWAQRGIAQVQDPTAALAVKQLDIQNGQTVLDRCAGLGTKTLQMHEYIGEEGRIVAIDPNGSRCEMLRRLLTARGITNVTVHQTDMLSKIMDSLPPAFERILIDAPCSNSGVLARRPEAKYAQTNRALQSLQELQLRILHDTVPRLASGGVLVYSTCSTWPEENEQVVRCFLAQQPELSSVDEQSIMPSLDPDPARYRDGGYLAVLRRN